MTTVVALISSGFLMVFENICTICLENFHTEYGKCVATVPLFSETFNKEVSNVLCEKPIMRVELLLELRTDHFTVVGLATRPLNGSEAGVDLVLIQTSLLLLRKSSCSYAN